MKKKSIEKIQKQIEDKNEKNQKQIENKNNLRFNLISLYVSWGDEPRCQLPGNVIDSIYKDNAIPMITWEPWQDLFKSTKKLKSIQESQNNKDIKAKLESALKEIVALNQRLQDIKHKIKST